MKRREMLIGALGTWLWPVYGEQAPPRRKAVVPQQVIEAFDLKPTTGYGLFVFGEDGKPYSLDDVLGIIFEFMMASSTFLKKGPLQQKRKP